jgi:hypothetical protein
MAGLSASGCGEGNRAGRTTKTHPADHNDLPMLEGVVLLAAFFVIIANLLVDLAYAAHDPRVRYS